MLFESFTITLNYRDLPCELDIRERYANDGSRSFEVIQGGIGIILLTFDKGDWTMCIADDLHEIVKHDTETFVSDGLVKLLVQAIVNYYDCFTERKILYNNN